MIEKMNKYSFLVYYKEYNTFLEQIRSLGVVHIIEKQKGEINSSSKLYKNIEEAQRIKNVISFLTSRLKGENPIPDIWKEENLLTKIEDLKSSLEHATAAMQLLHKEIERMSIWGNFSFDLIEKLKAAGQVISFYSCSERNYKKEWENQFNAIVINHHGTQNYFITVTPSSIEDIAADKVILADRSYADLQKESKELELQIKQINAAIDECAIKQISTLQQMLVDVQNDIAFDNAILNTEAEVDQKVMILEGWVPVVKEEGLINLLNKQNIYFKSCNPTENDKVPILLRNNKFAKLFEIIGELYSLPNYFAMDLTPFFAPFFVMFFGLCLGDAGYGSLMVLGASYVLAKGKVSVKPIARLVLYLGIGTIIFGTVSGTFFGLSLLDAPWPWLSNLKKIMLNSNQLFYFALIMGAIQISFAMIVKGIGQILYKGFKYSLDTWGWLLCLWGNAATYSLSTLGILTPEIAKPIYIGVNAVAFTCMLFFNNPDANIFINFGGGLWGLYNKLTGILGDMLSYIRLFALGISGAVMGLVFNQLAINMSGNIPVLSQIIMVIILVIGHSMNIFMSGLSAFVHPMRLTFVEFYNNAGFEGGGKKYNPFKKIKKS